MQIDFSAFDYHPSFTERLKQMGKWQFISGIVSISVVFAILVILCLYRNWAGLVSPLIVLAVLLVPLLAYYRESRRVIQLQRFAAVNGFSYTHNAPFDSRDGVIFGEGHSQKFIDLLRAPTGNFAEIGNYEYITGDGKNQQTHHFGFVRIKLPRKLPNMVLDSKGNNTFGRFSNLPESFSRGQKLSLEGNFDNYFTLYAPAEYKTDALYIFTPDVMQALIETVGDYDCEIVDDDFYIYTQPKFVMTNRASFERILQIVNTLKPELTKESRYYTDAKIGDITANLVAPEGARLKTHMSVVTIMVIILMVVLFGFNTIADFIR